VRYYSIKIVNAQSGKLYQPPAFASLNLPFSYGSYVNGQTLPGALDIELDVEQAPQGAPPVGSWVRIHGVSLAEIAQAQNFNPAIRQVAAYNISLEVGMQKGLPLANPAEIGIIASGGIYQSFGNWIGNDMTLEFIFGPNVGTETKPVNIVHLWRKGTPLGPVIKATLQLAFPGFTITGTDSLNPGLVFTASNFDTTFCQSLDEYAAYLNQLSKSIIGDQNYDGVDIAVLGKTINVYDYTTPPPAKQINFQDLIGQPTWLAPLQVSVKTVMRGDIQIGGVVTLPQTAVTQTATTLGSFASKSIFQGSFKVQGLRHVGHFRQPAADSWVTVMDLAAMPV
jgi:hypothetical protein